MKVAIYCRLSEEDHNKLNKEDDSNSIKNQKAMLMQYSLRQSWDIYDIYSDDDYTGSDRNRPQFKRLLADAEARRFDIILCKTQSRFTRELALVEKYIHGLFPIWGIRFVSIVDNADTANKGNKKSRQINALVNEWYLEDMSENIRSVLTNRRENGFHIGAFAPYGYQKDPNRKGHLIIDPDAAENVREIFSMFADGYGKSAIARRLNDRGVPNPTEYKRRKGLRYYQPAKAAGTLWKYPTIAEILANEVYIGNLVQGKYGSISYKTRQCSPRPKEQWIRVEGTHEAIIEPELWARVQQKVCSHARPISTTGMIHIFSGIVVCIHCGYAVRPHRNHGHYYLQCDTKYISQAACPGAFIPGAELERTVLAELCRLNTQFLDQSLLQRETKLEAVLNAKKSKLESDLRGYQEKIVELTNAMNQLYIDKANGLITPRDYLEMQDGFQRERTRYEEMSMSSRKRINDINISIQVEDHYTELIAQYIHAEHLTRSMTETLIDRIKIGKRNTETGLVPVLIFWNF